jgi:hypothetical protein
MLAHLTRGELFGALPWESSLGKFHRKSYLRKLVPWESSLRKLVPWESSLRKFHGSLRKFYGKVL